MKVVLIIDWFIYYTIELAKALAEQHDVMLIVRDHNYEISSPEQQVSLNDFLDQCLDKRVSWDKLRYRRRSLKGFSEIWRIFKKIWRFSPDVIHFQENSDWRYLLIALLFRRKKTVVTIHDVVIHPGDKDKTRMRFVFPALVRKVLIDRANGLIVHGEYLRRQLVSISKKHGGKAFAIPHGPLWVFKKWDENTVDEEEHTILFFGRISKYKGIEVLIRAQPLIAKEISGVKIIIAGKGKEEDFGEYEKLIEDRRYFEIHYRFIANSEVPKFFRRAAVVVLPYIEASQSGVVQVAYVFGKPVVVTNVGSIPEVVDDGKTGFVVPPNNPEALARALIELLKNWALRQTMSKNIQEKLATDLSWERIARKTTEIYESLRWHD